MSIYFVLTSIETEHVVVHYCKTINYTSYEQNFFLYIFARWTCPPYHLDECISNFRGVWCTKVMNLKAKKQINVLLQIDIPVSKQ